MADNCCDKKKDSGELDARQGSKGLKPLVAGEVENIFRVSGVDCNDEIEAITKALNGIGVTSLNVNLIASTVTVRHPTLIPKQRVMDAIESTGVKINESEALGFVATNRRRITLIVLSGLSLLAGMILGWLELGGPTVELVLFGASTLTAGVLVFPKAIRAIKSLSLDMNVLMSVAVIGAFAIKEYSESATVVFLFSLAELLESFSVDRARRAIREVLKLTPQVAWKKQGDAIISVPVLELAPGDLILVKPGENIPLDGTVMEGNSSVNQAPVTGESKLVKKAVGDSVYAGTLNENGILLIEVTKAFQDTKISKVMRLVEEAQTHKAPSEKFVDRFARIYTPVVFVLAVLTALVVPYVLDQDFNLWLYRALVLLVIACPCALVLATPISVVSGLASLARRGVLVKGGVHLEALGKLRTIAVDKTGTLTEGKFTVQSFRKFSETSEAEIFQVAQALESVSSHPLAKAVLDFIAGKGLPKKSVDKYRTVPGRGAEGYVDSHLYFVGNHRFAHELGVCTPELEAYLGQLETQAMSVVIVGHAPHDGHGGDVLGVFALGDTLRANAKSAVASLHRIGIGRVVILSGDNQKTVDAIREASGIDEAYGDLLPEDKVSRMKALVATDKNVAMVGDGINDAPALAHATVGISMGAAGTDAAIETSDIALMQDNLEELPKAIQQGRRVLNTIRFNIGFALVTKLVFLVLAVIGISNLWLAVAADMGASIFVTLNALRLLRVDGKSAV